MFDSLNGLANRSQDGHELLVQLGAEGRGSSLQGGLPTFVSGFRANRSCLLARSANNTRGFSADVLNIRLSDVVKVEGAQRSYRPRFDASCSFDDSAHVSVLVLFVQIAAANRTVAGSSIAPS